MTFTTLEDLLSVFAATEDADRLAKFAQGDALLLASAPDVLTALGFGKRPDLFAAVGQATGMSRRALLYRARVAETFGPDERGVPVSWEVYRAASGMVDPLYWLARAADEHLSAEKLRAVYKHAQGKDADEIEIVWQARNVDAEFVRGYRDARGMYLVFRVAHGSEVGALTLGAAGQLSFSVATVHGRAQSEQEAA